MDIRINADGFLWRLEPQCRWPKLAAHHSAWPIALANGLGHTSYLLTAHDHDGSAIGYLPLAFVKSWVFGRFLVSLPYLNTGGVWADQETVASSLIDRAVSLADSLDVKHLELRHETPVAHKDMGAERTDKVHMRLKLPADPDSLMKSFKSKLRSQVKKSTENDFEMRFGGLDALSDFYDVFAHNMRDLGTPVYSQRLFESILNAFGDAAELCVVTLQRKPIAGALLIHANGVTEVPSASSLRKFNSTGANMWMYWQLLCRAIERGSHTFDFGRSSVGSGTYKFKEQWGATPYPAVWQYYVRSGSPADMRPDSPKRQRLIQIWQRLPVPVTRFLGPRVVRGIP